MKEGPNRFILQYLRQKYEQAVSSKIIRSLENKKVRKVADLYCEDNTESYKRQFEQFWKAVAEE